MKRLLLAGLFTALAVVANANPLPLVFGIQLLLGSVFAVLALLLWRGWWGVGIGVVASLYTWKLWGHPWAVLIFSLEILWLAIALNRFNGPAERDGEGGVILFNILYWLLIGAPLVLLFYGGVLQFDSANVLVAAVKQSLNGITNTGLAFLIFLLLRLWQSNRQTASVSLRGLVFALVLTAITAPTLALTVFTSQQLVRATQQGELDTLEILAQAVGTPPMKELADPNQFSDGANPLGKEFPQTAVLRRDSDGRQYNSDPALFSALERDYESAGSTYGLPAGLEMLVQGGPQPQLRKWVNGYWSHSVRLSGPQGETEVQVVQPARTLVTRLQDQSARMLAILTAVVVLGALVSEAIGRWFEGQFRAVLDPFTRSQPGEGIETAMPNLAESMIGELRTMADLLNTRISRVNSLTRSLERLSTTDPLTGCLNRRELFRLLREEMARCRRNGEQLCCLSLDLDHFKQINDQFGHAAGDAVLVHVCDAVRAQLRLNDHFFRIGGEEFLVLFSGNDRAPDATSADTSAGATAETGGLQSGEALAERLRAVVAEQPTRHGDTWIPITMSIGLSQFRHDSDTEESLLLRSDRALYAAKQQGRNRIVKG
ncbi:MAG: diguanylate cyclase [Prochlorococcaceae cyanobacterium]